MNSNEHAAIQVEGRPRRNNQFVEGIGKVGKGAFGASKKSVMAVTSVLDDFKEFINKGNVVDLAVGLVMGAAFTAIVSSFVKDLITPIISLASPANTLENQFVILRCPTNNVTKAKISCDTSSYSTVAIATSAGAVTFNYGSFIQVIISLFRTLLTSW